jgi:hypothetical protein
LVYVEKLNPFCESETILPSILCGIDSMNVGSLWGLSGTLDVGYISTKVDRHVCSKPIFRIAVSSHKSPE